MTNAKFLGDVIATIENTKVVSKYRAADADNNFEAVKAKMSDAFVSQFKANSKLRGFVNTAEKVSKLRAVIADASCETAICAGVVELYKECNPNIFEMMPNYTEIPCDGKKDVKFGRKGSFRTAAPSTTLAVLTELTDLTSTVENEILLGCVTKTPKVVQGKYATKIADAYCDQGDALKLVCFTVDTLALLEEHFTFSIQSKAVEYFKSIDNVVTAPTGTLKDIIRELINQSEMTVGGFGSSDMFLFVNPAIIRRMAMENYEQGAPVFPNLGLECGSLYCDTYCIDGVAKVIVLPESILPKVTNQYQLILIKADQFDAGSSDSVIAELNNDLSMLINGMKNLVGGYKPYMIEEISQFAGKTTYSTLIN